MVIIWKQASNAQHIITLYVSFFQNDDDFYRPQEGNIFRSVCQSFCPGAGGLHPRGSGSGSGEWVSIQGGGGGWTPLPQPELGKSGVRILLECLCYNLHTLPLSFLKIFLSK